MADQLVDFLRRRKEQDSYPELNWQAKKQEWIQSVEQLYCLIQEMLSESVASHDVQLVTRQDQLTEDFLGHYTLPVLELHIGSERVEFLPKGLLVVAASGRVDLRGEGGTVTLLRDEAADGGWSVLVQRLPRPVKVPLDRESLQHALESVMRPMA